MLAADREHVSKRKKTSMPSNIAAAWDKLVQTGSTQAELEAQYSGGHPGATGIPPELQDEYRLDPFGNVVSITAVDGAVCYFNSDHIFPW